MDISKIGFGCVTFGREIDEQTSHRLLDHAADRGITFFDTASAYASGASEMILGKWLTSRRSDSGSITIATKILPPYHPEGMEELIRGSLERLGVDAIDLLYLHSWHQTAESLDCLATLDAFVQSGKVRAIGVSNVTRPQLTKVLAMQDAHGLARFGAVQNNFNYAVSDLDLEYRKFCHKEGIKVVSYSPLGAGFLTGKHKRGVEAGSRFDIIPGHQDVYFHDEAWERLARLEEVAEQAGISQAHLALAWAMHQPGIDSVLVGGRTTAHLDQALAALEWEDVRIFGELDKAT